MSNGTYCSASQRIDSASSSGDMAGREIFLMMTECPDREVPNSGLRTFSAETIRLTVSTTREASMMAPSTIASGERLSRPVLTRRYPPPFASFSSTSLIAEDPISSPTRFLDFLNSTLSPHRKISDGYGLFPMVITAGCQNTKRFFPSQEIEPSKPTVRQRVKPIGQVRPKKASCSFLLPARARCRLRGFFRVPGRRGGFSMAQHCQFCGKTPMSGHRISHAHNVTNRKWHLNLKTVRSVIDG